MKRLIFIIASILLGQTVCAQDIIQKKDATEIQAKVLKITDTEIEYQRWDNPDGPIYTIPAEDVFTITYQNGSKEVISHFDSSRRSAADKQQFGKLPRYQGEVAFAYGSAVSEGMQDLFPRIVFETVHGVRINPYLFAGVGLGINYFYKDIYFSNGWNIYELGNSGTVLPVFANVKGYLPVSRKAALNLSWDLGAAIGIGGYFNEGTEFYTSIGPGVPLIVVNCIILGRAEMFACKNSVVDSALDGIGMGIGYTLTVVLMATIREILGSGTWLGFKILPDSVAKIGIMTQAPGAFFCFGLLMAGCVWLEGKLDARIERKSCCDIDNLKKEAE